MPDRLPVGAASHDFPAPGAVRDYFYTWRDDSGDQTIHDLAARRHDLRDRSARYEESNIIHILRSETRRRAHAGGFPTATARPATPGHEEG